MKILELIQHVEVSTPKGKATVWLVTDYGSEIEKIFTVIVKDTGEIWEFKNKDIKCTDNVTIGRITKK